MGARWFLRERVIERPMTVAFSDQSWWDTARFAEAEAGRWPADPLLFVTMPAPWDPALARGEIRQVALLGTLSSPDPESPMAGEAIGRAEAMAERLWPSLRRHLIHRERFTPRHVSRASRDAVLPGQGGECIGLGQLIGQCGRSKPDSRSPLPGLWFVGCDAGGHGCGWETHQAVESAWAVAKRLLASKAPPR